MYLYMSLRNQALFINLLPQLINILQIVTKLTSCLKNIDSVKSANIKISLLNKILADAKLSKNTVIIEKLLGTIIKHAD